MAMLFMQFATAVYACPMQGLPKPGEAAVAVMQDCETMGAAQMDQA